jgi:hypothetical protein
VHPQLPSALLVDNVQVHPQLTKCTAINNVEVTVGEEEKCESTNIYSGVTASSREGSKSEAKKVARSSLGAPPPPEKNPGYALEACPRVD